MIDEMNKMDAHVLILSFSLMIIDSILSLLGEGRFDAYVSLFIVVYFVSIVFSDSFRRLPRRHFIDGWLLVLFIIIVLRRILEVLGGS